jgi:trehalose 6-phosphate synthase
VRVPDPLVIVSNRGPLGFRRANGSLETIRGAGGLVSALRPLVKRHEVSWVASALGGADREVAAAGARTERFGDGADFRLHLVAHDPEVFARFYAVVANPVLWFVQHGLWDLKDDPDADLGEAWSDGYVEANRALAAAAVVELDRRPEAAVFVHDYHLYLVPSLVRQARPAARIAHFVHIPWVGPTEWSVLPATIARAIHEGLLACDSIGFHTERWRAAFVESCAALLARGDEAEARSHANPIAVDVRELAALARSPAVQERRRDLLAVRPELLVLRVDRTDPSKNAVRGFAAFERLLELEPDLRRRVQLVALLDPSRQEIPEYVEYTRATVAAAAAVNDRFGEAGWQPVRLDMRDDFPASIAAFLEYDVLLVNPVMDGLNLVAKEAPLVNERLGVVVLSRQAGAYEELGDWVLGVDPLDVEEQAEALRTALGLDREERERRGDAIRDRVRRHDLDAWADRELDELARRTTAGALEA